MHHMVKCKNKGFAWFIESGKYITVYNVWPGRSIREQNTCRGDNIQAAGQVFNAGFVACLPECGSNARNKDIRTTAGVSKPKRNLHRLS
jgi:hypothetical protein